ncbi:hypothetical protein [Nocardia spumae]|uniref:hypothetical protein n=1 Tax=Nocardia spumae TaxID=2887190 RepID=UPI001D151D8B|nr:hypothetical protein [Nocardia spumae]
MDRKIARVIDGSRSDGWSAGAGQGFLRTRVGDPVHRQLVNPLPHKGVGRSSAFTQRQRHVSPHALETAASTADL